MIGWHHRVNVHESEQTRGDSEGQGSLACCSLLSCKESDLSYQLSNNNKTQTEKPRDHHCVMRLDSEVKPPSFSFTSLAESVESELQS